jgi:5-methyltetrahydropteroyltriglutamate--homocysteine methyltransferase
MSESTRIAAGPRTTPPFRADHVGSLLRPPALLQARRRFAAGEIDAAALHAAEDAAIRDVVALQRDCGLRSITDGEFRRGSWHMDFIYELGGVERDTEHQFVSHFRNAEGGLDFTPAGSRVVGRVGLEHTIFGDAFSFLRDAVGDAGTPKLTIPAPSMVHYRGGRAAIDADVYPDLDAFWSDLGDAYRAEIAALAQLGCTYLQLDDTSLAYLNDPEQRRQLAARGDDADHQHETYIATVNRALADRPAGMTVTTHMCRGNFRSSWVAEGGYEFVAESMFNELAVDAFFLEYDDERSGGFEPLRFVPADKLVVLGLVTSKRGELESRDDLKRRLDEASRFIDLDQVCLSPQCGFSSTVDGNALTVEQEAAKLRLVVDTAAEVWGAA